MNHRLLPLAILCLAFSPAATAADEAPNPLKEAFQLAAKGDMEGAAKIIKKEAEGGNAEAANAYGEMLLGNTKSKNASLDALPWFQKAAEQSHPAGLFNLALLNYKGGEGIPKDEDQGRFLLKSSAEAGYAPAQYQMGVLMDAEAIKEDKPAGYVDAFVWFEKAAEQGHAGALYTASRYYEQGLGGKPKDMPKSTEYCGKAARAGSAMAMNEYAVRLQKGVGVGADPIAAIGYFIGASQAGIPAAQTNLGNAFENGVGARQDFNQAGTYYAAAAKQGFHAAEFLLAQMFEEGRGTEVDYVKAYTLFGRAAVGKIEEAVKRQEAIKGKLTENQRTAADKAIAEEVKKSQPAENAPEKPAEKEAAATAAKPTEAPKAEAPK